MNNIFKYVFFTYFFVFGVDTVFAQDYSAEAKVFFSKYLSTRSYFDLCKKSLPELKDCKMVLKAEHAYTMLGASVKDDTTDNKLTLKRTTKCQRFEKLKELQCNRTSRPKLQHI